MKMAYISDKKKKVVAELQKLISEYPIIGAVNMEGMPAPQLQKMRAQLRGKVTILMTKRRLIHIAIENSKDKKKGIEKLEPYLKGMPALIFTKDNPFALFKTLKKSKSKAPAKAGQTAPADITVKAGPTSFAPGPIIGELGSIGIKCGVEGGKVAVKEDSVVVKEGGKIGAKQAEILTRLGIEPMDVGLDLVATYEDGTIFTKDVLNIDEAEFDNKLQNAARWAVNLSVYAGYPTKDTIKLMIGKAFNDAKAIGLEQNIIEEGIIEELLGKAERQGQSLKATANVPGKAPEAKPEEKKEAPKEEPKAEKKPKEEPKPAPKPEEKSKEAPKVPEPKPAPEVEEKPKAEEKPKEAKAPEPKPKIPKVKEEIKKLEEEKEIIKEEQKLEKPAPEEEAPVEKLLSDSEKGLGIPEELQKEVKEAVKEEEEKVLEKERIEKEKQIEKIEKAKTEPKLALKVEERIVPKPEVKAVEPKKEQLPEVPKVHEEAKALEEEKEIIKEEEKLEKPEAKIEAPVEKEVKEAVKEEEEKVLEKERIEKEKEVEKIEKESETDRKVADMVAKMKQHVAGTEPTAEQIVEEVKKEMPKEKPKSTVGEKEDVPSVHDLAKGRRRIKKDYVPTTHELAKKKRQTEHKTAEELAQELIKKGTLRK